MSFWNWKSALLSANVRAAIFLVANLPAGLGAGGRAWLTEFAFRTIASGLLGSLTQRCSRLSLSPRLWAVTVVSIAAAGHAMEYAVHSFAGTPRIGTAIVGSMLLTMLSTSFHMFVMRRNMFTTGRDSQSLLADIAQLTRLVADAARTLWGSRRYI